MDALASDDIFLFEGFRLERRGGGLLRRDEHGVFVPVAIGSRAVDVLGVLAERPGDLVLRDEIIAAVWPTTVVGDNNLNMQIAALRRILDDRRSEGSCIQTVAGRGYRFAAAVTRIAVGARAGVTALPESGVGLRPRLSIIVLPFTSLSDDPERPYFADAITEDLATDLSRIGGMLVISPNTAFTYRNKLVDTKQIGRELGVRYLLLGSVQRSENRVRVTARLIDAETDSHLWAERFAGDTGDLFALQDEITSRIAVALNLALVRAEVARPTANPDARDYVLRGRAVLNKPPTHESYAEAIGLFERALELDPWSVQAQSWSALALANRVLGQMAASAEIDIARAEGLVGRALAELPSSPLAHFAKGQILRAQRRFEEAIPEFEMVVAADRNAPAAISILGSCKFFAGSTEEMIPAQEQAIRLSPRDPVIGIWYGRVGEVHLLQSRADEAIPWFEKARSANPGLPYAHAFLASVYALTDKSERAAVELAEARRLASNDRFSSLARLRAVGNWGVPKIRALYETTYIEGLRKAGIPEE
jgi:TolB-like protein